MHRWRCRYTQVSLESIFRHRRFPAEYSWILGKCKSAGCGTDDYQQWRKLRRSWSRVQRWRSSCSPRDTSSKALQEGSAIASRLRHSRIEVPKNHRQSFRQILVMSHHLSRSSLLRVASFAFRRPIGQRSIQFSLSCPQRFSFAWLRSWFHWSFYY